MKFLEALKLGKETNRNLLKKDEPHPYSPVGEFPGTTILSDSDDWDLEPPQIVRFFDRFVAMGKERDWLPVEKFSQLTDYFYKEIYPYEPSQTQKEQAPQSGSSRCQD